MSTVIFNDGEFKSRLVRKDNDWFVAEYKSATDNDAPWFPWIAGTAAFLQLTEQDKAWAKGGTAQ